MVVASIPGFNVHKVGRDKYAVSVNNGNMGASIVNKSQLKMMADMYGGEVKDTSIVKKVVAGVALAGAVAAAVVYRKNISKFFQGFLKPEKVGETAKKAGEKISQLGDKVKEGAVSLYDKTAVLLKKVWDKVSVIGKKCFEAVLNLFESKQTGKVRDAKGRFTKSASKAEAKV